MPQNINSTDEKRIEPGEINKNEWKDNKQMRFDAYSVFIMIVGVISLHDYYYIAGAGAAAAAEEKVNRSTKYHYIHG